MKRIILAFLVSIHSTSIYCALPISFWNGQQKGTNSMNRVVKAEDIGVAKTYGIKFIRLASDKFITSARDFLLGDADNYQGLVPQDVQKLKEVLDICANAQMPVVLTMLSLPGSRWKQNNNDVDDLRIWNNDNFKSQAAQFWGDMAREFKGHPAIVGYNILNEPHPEKMKALLGRKVSDQEVHDLLFDLYTIVISSIRSVDTEVPIILDSSAYGDPRTFTHLPIINDPYVIYSFHMYEPYEYTNLALNQGSLTYPGIIAGNYWNKEKLKDYMQPVVDFQKRHGIASNRILVGEFGGNRNTPGLPDYFRDLISIFMEENWHFAFYAFREDTWEGMDYELGNTQLGEAFWLAEEKGEPLVLQRDPHCPLFKVLYDALQESNQSN